MWDIVNYFAALYEYDEGGSLERTQEPTGTIYRTVYDGLERPVSSWVGTNDTTGNGNEWSPTNQGSANLVDVSDYAYDVDSNLTQQTDHPRDGTPDRLTQYLYDNRDRLVAEKDGAASTLSSETNSGVHRPLIVYTVDNLGEVTQVDRYDGDGISPTTTPSSTLLRGRTIEHYDDQGRVYQDELVSVDGSGNTGPSLYTNYFYDHRGNLVATSHPGGTWDKTAFDAAGRDTADYVTDGGALNDPLNASSWADATSLTHDLVLQEADHFYDGDGNETETITRQRFHDDATTATGPLGTPTAGVHARDYYSANYYDLAGRLTTTLDVGTNNGQSWTPPLASSLPTRSNTILRTDYAYTTAGFLSSVTDPLNLMTLNSYDALGDVTQTIEGATASPYAPTQTTNRTTNYRYDGLGDVLLAEAALPGGAVQDTAYVYGTDSASNLFSNDLLTKVELPSKSTGAASTAAADDQAFTYNALGERASFLDPNGTKHTYGRDSLGRLTADKVPQFGAGVDQLVKSLAYSYDSAGRPFQQTSLSDATGVIATGNTNVLNQVQDAYDGFGQLTTEYQAHIGAVNTAPTGSPRVQYLYTQAAGAQNNSRLTGIVYPNGRALDYLFGAQVKLSSLTASGAVATATSATGLPAGLGVGSLVTIGGASPAAYDGTFTVTSVNPSLNQFTYTMASSPGASSGSLITATLSQQMAVTALTSANSGANTTVTVTTAVAGNLAVGASVTISGSGQPLFNGTFTVAGIVNATQFTYTVTGVNLPQSGDSGKDLFLTINPSSLQSLDNTISRVTALADHSGTFSAMPLEAYQYLGLDTIVQRSRPLNGTDLTYVPSTTPGGDGGDQYTGLDRFGRVSDQYWLNSTTSTTTDRFQYGYDANSNVLYRLNPVNTAFSELYHGNGSINPYDSFNRLTEFQRGTLSSDHTSIQGTASTDKTWTLDTLGNWGTSTDVNNPSAAVTTNGTAQNRSHNLRDQYTKVGTSTPSYNNNGDTTNDTGGNVFRYDAWDRAVSAGAETLTYDADGRRPSLSICAGAVTDSYYSSDWQVMEEDSRPLCGGPVTTNQYVWGLGYIDQLVLRDDNSTSGSLGKSGSGLGRRLFAQQDANYDVTSILDTSGVVKERFDYDPYGARQALNAGTWANAADSFSWVYGWQGLRFDNLTNTYDGRERIYSVTLDRWLQPDPLGYVDGLNPYQPMDSNPIAIVDPTGLGGYNPQVAQELARRRAAELAKEAKTIGFVYEIEGYDPETGTKVYYTGSTSQELADRLDKKHPCNKMKLLQDDRTKVTVRQVYAEPNVKASGRGTVQSATNEALRAAEQTIMDKSGHLPDPADKSVINKLRAASEENHDAWLQTHKVAIGEKRQISVKTLRVSSGACVSIALWLEKYTIGTLVRAKENNRTYLEQLEQDAVGDDMDKIRNDDVWLMGPGFMVPNPDMYRRREIYY